MLVFSAECRKFRLCHMRCGLGNALLVNYRSAKGCVLCNDVCSLHFDLSVLSAVVGKR